MHDGDRRGNSRQRGYTVQWEHAARAFKVEHPLCRGCLAVGRYVAAELVDHVVPHRGNQDKFWDRSKWQSSCRWHHDVIKSRLERMFDEGLIAEAELWLDSDTAKRLSTKSRERRTIGADGWPT